MQVEEEEQVRQEEGQREHCPFELGKEPSAQVEQVVLVQEVQLGGQVWQAVGVRKRARVRKKRRSLREVPGSICYYRLVFIVDQNRRLRLV